MSELDAGKADARVGSLFDPLAGVVLICGTVLSAGLTPLAAFLSYLSSISLSDKANMELSEPVSEILETAERLSPMMCLEIAFTPELSEPTSVIV